MKNAVITGATGPLGIALITLLIEKEINVIAIVRKDSPRASRMPNSPFVHILEAELSQLCDIGREIDCSCGAFFHFGWTNTENRAERDNIDAQLKNVKYSIDAARLAKKLGCRVFIGAGSQSEYGEITGRITEKTPENPTEPYGIAKLSAMMFCKSLCRQLDMRFGWLRILSMYGPYDRDTTFISYCIKELLQGREPKLTPCMQLWDYIYSKDAARAFWLLAEKGRHDAVYPLSSGTERTLRGYAETLRDAVAPGLQLGFGELAYPPGQRMSLTADISAITRDLGFVPEYSFERGIAETAEYYLGCLK